MPESPAPMMTTSKCSVKGVRCGSALLPSWEAKALHYAPEERELPRFVCGVGGSHGRFATGTDEGVRPYTSKRRTAYFAALATFTPLEVDA